MNDPQPIATAPQNGTVILTNDGPARYVTGPGMWAPPGWYVCSPQGDVFECADHGFTPCFPALWVPLPDWMN